MSRRSYFYDLYQELTRFITCLIYNRCRTTAGARSPMRRLVGANNTRSEPWQIAESKLYTAREMELKVETDNYVKNEIKVKIEREIRTKIKSLVRMGMRSTEIKILTRDRECNLNLFGSRLKSESTSVTVIGMNQLFYMSVVSLRVGVVGTPRRLGPADKRHLDQMTSSTLLLSIYFQCKLLANCSKRRELNS
ncbi:hypothetical protein EVAR_54093_1 [Eumeta japonica]|uniref:Uncharacterized protein n=1 Tax=Eumeta variegata TaxID=151549 RepID=A0A4C1Z7J0_EUMVA|nr:hypothetical protein EVAR_54093_1 [Eumeta japonica]